MCADRRHSLNIKAVRYTPKIRARVEHLFGGLEQMGGKMIRTIGPARASFTMTMMAACYNLKQWFISRSQGSRPSDTEVSEVWAAMTSQAELRGKPMSAFDSIIGSTAYANGCKLVTRNVGDFAGTSIDLINPWSSDR